MAGHGGDAGFRRQLLGGDLVAHRPDGPDRRADEGDAFLLQRLGEGGVLRQEAIAGMHGVRAGPADRLDDFLDDDIGLRGRGGADMHGLVGHGDMQRAAIRVGIDGDGRNAELLRGLDDPAGDLAAIGDQDFLEHQVSSGPGLSLYFVS